MTGVQVFSGGAPASPIVLDTEVRRVRDGTTGEGARRSTPDAGVWVASGIKWHVLLIIQKHYSLLFGLIHAFISR